MDLFWYGGSWTPYTESEEELKLLTKEGALLVVGEGNTTFKDVFNVTKVDSRSIFLSVQLMVYRFHKNYTSKNDVEGIERNTIDIEINISNQRSEKIENFWIGTMDKMDDESADRFTMLHVLNSTLKKNW